ncbi:exo-beta-N-acetylmuramidase NamZ domain-containing protein [Bremerella alba]|uniref:D-aminopeptidase n=1 Tax=Bremerella alba TaxID=980252 RepID=A0A7V8V5D9_9BACT|nr:exo-beta-N-acetylmuramidase NamZ domain-containing protein [Bremerella alba]MBA2115263.1 D-aminopeptidase [Bremerella alba]
MSLRSCIVVMLFLVWSLRANADLYAVPPEITGMANDITTKIDQAIDNALSENKMPGCVVVVACGGKVIYKKAHGNRRVEPSVEPMTIDTVFDMASLTKPIVTATSILQLVESGQVDLNAPVANYLPEFRGHDKETITIKQLLIHTSGLTPDNALSDYENGWPDAYGKICNLKLLSVPGDRFRYSDVGFILLGEVVARVSGKPLDLYAAEQIFKPLGMSESGFNPNASLARRAVTTTKVNGEWLKGTVHDPRARYCDGVAGHAGLFSTADDLLLFAQAMLDARTPGPNHLFKPQTLTALTNSYNAAGSLRGLGWDKQSGYSSNRGKSMSSSAYGHGGFTGTALWIDPQLELAVIFLSNRVHPNEKGSVNALAGRIGTIAADACLKAQKTSALMQTKLGVDVLADRQFDLLKGKKVGLIANHTSRNKSGKPTHLLFDESPEVDLVALFSPEHGFAGSLDQSHIGDMVDPETGIAIKSLYGETRKPTPKQLEGIDILVFDIQDIGCRFYTYISTMGLAMEAAAEQGIPFMVLDRPNPLGGDTIEGPLLDRKTKSFVAFHSIPVRHGMTIGELAKMMNQERGWKTDLTVVPLTGWGRGQLLFDTGLPWRNTSPNMRNLTQAMIYPGVGLLETTNVSVGRGTDTPFEVLGAPWIDGPKLATLINSHNLPGVKVIGVEFTPASSKYAEQQCGGVNFIITNWEAFRPLDLGWATASSLHALYPKTWETERLHVLLSNDAVKTSILQTKSPQEISASYEKNVDEFAKRREPFLIYP